MHSSPRSDPVSLSGRHLFVTGGTGFVGRSLLDYLAESAALHGDDLRVTALTRQPQRFLDRHPRYGGLTWLEFVQGDLDSLPRPVRPVTDLVHAAADTHRLDSDRLAWLDQLTAGTHRVLEYAREQRVERVLYVSSGAVYGIQPPDVAALPEDWPQAPRSTDPGSVYGTGKRMAEHLCALYGAQHGLDIVIARCFALLSEHVPLDGPYAAGNFLRDALAGEAIRVRGDGKAVRTYLDGRDMAHWMVTLLRRGVAGEAYNVGSDRPVSTLDLARRIGARLAPHKPVVVENARAVGQGSTYVPDIAKAGLLGLRVETDLDASIADAVARIRE